MDHVLPSGVFSWRVVRAALSLSAYCAGFVVVVSMMLLAPYQALAVQYSRVLTAGAMGSAYGSKVGTIIPAAAQALANAGPGTSVAVRVATAGAGWPALGVMAGLTLFSLYYNNAQHQQIVDNNTSQGTITLPSGHTIPDTYKTCPGNPDCQSGALGYITIDYTLCFTGPPYPQVPAGWDGWFILGSPNRCVAHQMPGDDPPPQVPGAPPTAQDIQDYLNGLDSSDPLAPVNNLEPGGHNHTSPNADTSVNIPIDSSEVTTQVVPTSSVDPDDIVLNSNATPPQGTTTQDTTNTDTTDTTTTTNNPDGSTTQETESEATIECSIGEHDPRTYGSILKQAIDSWQETGLLSQLNTLKTLTWPDTVPIISINSGLFGEFNIDFTAWAGTLTTLRTLIIGVASFAAYRIIFGGASAS